MALYQPMQGPAPSSAQSIKDYITLVEAEEAQYPNSNRDTKLMLTRMRKIYYDTPGWNDTLIKGTAGINGHYAHRAVAEEPPYTIDLGIVGATSGDKITVVKTRYPAVDSSGNIPNIFNQQEIKLADGSYLDIGHVFAGLDAFNNFNKVGSASVIFTVDSNVDDCTWVGDLGSVLAELDFLTRRQRRDLTEAEQQVVINKYASAPDMLGNIDAYVIKQMFNIVSGKKVSEILREYFLGEYYTTPIPASVNARKYRFSKFSQGVGLILTQRNPVTFSNETTWIDKYANQINNSAAQYIYANTQPFGSGVQARINYLFGTSFAQSSRTLANRFLTTLKQRISAEPGQ
jgi:hypothetical protein